MKYSKILVFLILSVFLLAGNAFSYSITYDDDTLPTVFPNYTGTQLQDSLGTPKIDSITINASGDESNPGTLSSILITPEDGSGWIEWNALLINTGGDNGDWDAWDYIVYYGGNANQSYYGNLNQRPDTAWVTDFNAPMIYAVDSDNTPTYVADGTPSARVGHQNGLVVTRADLLSDFDISASWENGDWTYQFNSDITMYSDYVIGFTEWCSNDNVLTPVSEPATMLLLGTGLIGLAAIGRKRIKKG